MWNRWQDLLREQKWVAYVLPMAVYMIVGSFEPTPPDPDAAETASSWQVSYDNYPWIYAAKLALTGVAMVLAWPVYREFPCRVSGLAVVVGVVGVVLWIGLCQLRLEERLWALLGYADFGARPAFNPWEQWPDRQGQVLAYLVLRFCGLVAIVPIIEEFFLRGFLMRFVMRPDWWEVPFGSVNRMALVVGTVFPMLTHPGELLAAAAWFSMVTWLMVRTRNIWDCVTAHAITNGLLGAYVLATGEWRFL